MDKKVANNLNKLRSVEEVLQEFSRRGISVSKWARNEGYSPSLVLQVLSGKLKCIRGQAHDVAVDLGLKEGLHGDVSDLPFGKSEAKGELTKY